MAKKKSKQQDLSGEKIVEPVREFLGYLNYSNGKPDAVAQQHFNQIFAAVGKRATGATLRKLLLDVLKTLNDKPAFKDSTQAESVVQLLFDDCLPAYRTHHADLLFHLSTSEFAQPFFLMRMFEAILSQGGPWSETGRVVDGTLQKLNDFLGYRPIAVLENEQKLEPYAHERHRPVPLYLKEAGVAVGKYRTLIERTIAFFHETPVELLEAAYFDFENLQELALDMRSHDHNHPANKRTNYMFGEWDPHLIDSKGFYSRFIIRRIILDALTHWIDATHTLSLDERLHDAAAVLCGTILMASSISGSGPDTFSSDVTLTTLLPHVARQRDAFYARLMQDATGKRAKRLQREAKLTQQPFGHVRRHLNIDLARYGARQVQHRHLATQYARMGYSEASREEAAVIPAASIRIESEIYWRISAGHFHIDQGELDNVARLLVEIEDFLRRGIDCGALIDPWNILGFQAQFPLFTSREDAIPDQRVDTLIDLIERIFSLYSRALGEAAASGNKNLTTALSADFRNLANEWDRYATSTVQDVPQVKGVESWESATHVANAMAEWQSVGKAAGDISFWRQHVDRFQSPKAYAVVVEALLEKKDHVASMGLLMQWLNDSENVGMESGRYSIFNYLEQWLQLVVQETGKPHQLTQFWKIVRRMFDYLEANAGTYWVVPQFQTEQTQFADDKPDQADSDQNHDDDIYGAAYDDVVYRDSTGDGVEGETLDSGAGFGFPTVELEHQLRKLEPHLKFLNTLAHLWQVTAVQLASASSSHSIYRQPIPFDDAEHLDILEGWMAQTKSFQEKLQALMTEVSGYQIALPSGEHDSNIEYDLQSQAKYYLLHTTITTQVSCRSAERLLKCCLPLKRETNASTSLERQISGIYRAILSRDTLHIRQQLPRLLKKIAHEPLLYIAVENGGNPEEMLQIRKRQKVIRFFLSYLPALGMLNETWQTLRTAYRMERNSQPEGMAISEYDRLFRKALRGSLNCLIHSSTAWHEPAQPVAGLPLRRKLYTTADRRRKKLSPVACRRRYTPPAGKPMRVQLQQLPTSRQRYAPSVARRQLSSSSKWRTRSSQINFERFSYRVPRHLSQQSHKDRDYELVNMIGSLVEKYAMQWLKHSDTMRLSHVEALHEDDAFLQIKEFITEYGSNLFLPRMMTMGNVRTILHHGGQWFLNRLREEYQQNALGTCPLIEAIDNGKISEEIAADQLELIYGSILDKIDRFIEYNTTTTHSDYGDRVYCLIDFLRLESQYERDSWVLMPVTLTHEVLSTWRRRSAATMWEELLESNTSERAEQHLEQLEELEKKYGMHLPSLTDLIQERFVKSLAVDRMVSLVAPTMDDAAHRRFPSVAFERLQQEISNYIQTTSGSSFDIPNWLRSLEQEINRYDRHTTETRYNADPDIHFQQQTLRKGQVLAQLEMLYEQTG